MAAGRIKGITIEIGANTTKLTSALAKVDSALSKTQTNLRDLNKALKLDICFCVRLIILDYF